MLFEKFVMCFVDKLISNSWTFFSYHGTNKKIVGFLKMGQ